MLNALLYACRYIVELLQKSDDDYTVKFDFHMF